MTTLKELNYGDRFRSAIDGDTCESWLWMKVFDIITKPHKGEWVVNLNTGRLDIMEDDKVVDRVYKALEDY